jgi:hypothetical protein
MYAMIDLWPFPNIPGPVDWFKSLAGMFFDSQIGMLKFSLSLVFGISKATQTLLQSQWFSYRFDSWSSVGVDLFSLSIVALGLFVLMRFGKDSAKHGTRLITSLIKLSVYTRLFFPVVGGLYNFQQRASFAILQHFNGNSTSDPLTTLTHINSPTDVVGMFIGAIIGWLIAFVLVTVSVYLFLITIGVSLLNPIIIAIRPMGNEIGFFAKLFHWANAAFITVAASPIIMAFWLGVGISAIQHSQDFFPVGSSYVGIVVEDVILLLCIATPLFIMWASYKSSIGVFGVTESMMRAGIDIRSAPPISFREAQERVTNSRSSFITRAASTLAVATIDDRPKEPLTHKALDFASKYALRAGKPEIAAVTEVIKRQMQKSAPKTKKGGAA